MPHIHIRSFTPVALPYEKEGVRFDFLATNVEHPEEHLIGTSSENKEFLLLVQEGSEKSLLKSDKLTRPSKNELVQKALIKYAQACDLEVLGSNVKEQHYNPHLQSDSALKTIHDFAETFPADKDIRIEVGFGSGRHLLHQAKENPDILFIGIEIHRPSIEQVIKQINIQGLENLLLLDYDARLFMELVPSNIVSRIYVHFPVPWDKKPHRRVIGEAFVNEAIRVLAPEGKLELRTDSDNYFQFAYEVFTSLKKLDLHIYKNRDIAVSSKYEDRWKRMEKNIYDVIMSNDESSPALELNGNFEFTDAAFDLDKIAALNGTTQRFEGGFIHYERLYRITDGRLLFRVSMGSFDRPEHLYLILSPTRASYYPGKPVRTRTNLNAHTFLSEALRG